MIDLSHVTPDVSDFHYDHVAAVFLKVFRNNLIFQAPEHNPQSFLNTIIYNYSHPERFYHTLRHISETLLALEYQTRLSSRDYSVAQMAIIYHDLLLYNFQDGLSVEVQNSEPSSACFFVKDLGPYLDDLFVQDVHRTILATWYSKGIKPTNRLEEAVVNSDMHGFCILPEEFLKQTFRVWRESAGPTPDKEFFDKQLNFLKSLLEKEHVIAPLAANHEQLNEQARDNIQSSIKLIQRLVSDTPEPIITSIDEWYDGTPLTVPTHPEDDHTDSHLLAMDAEDYFKVYTKFHQAQKHSLTPLIAFYDNSDVKITSYVLGEELIIARNKEKLDMDFVKMSEQVKSAVTLHVGAGALSNIGLYNIQLHLVENLLSVRPLTAEENEEQLDMLPLSYETDPDHKKVNELIGSLTDIQCKALNIKPQELFARIIQSSDAAKAPLMEKNGLNLPVCKERDFAEGLYKDIEELEDKVSQWYTTDRLIPLSEYLGVTEGGVHRRHLFT